MFTWFFKATTAFITSGVTALGMAATPASDAGATITTNEWGGILAVAIISAISVFTVPNTQREDA